jgi:hypothetical protein
MDNLFLIERDDCTLRADPPLEGRCRLREEQSLSHEALPASFSLTRRWLHLRRHLH